MQSTGEIPTNSQLKDLADRQDWQGLLDATNIARDDMKAPVFLLCFRAMALKEIGALEEALVFAERAVARNPDSHWAQTLLFHIRIGLGRPDPALDDLLAYISGTDNDTENAKMTLVDQAMLNGREDIALAVNQTRKAICEYAESARYAVALQCFNKADVLEQVLQSLVACHNSKRFALTILQDSATGSRKQDIYAPAAAEVQTLLAAWLPRLLAAFDGVEILQNPVNKGTAPSCRRLLDRVSSRFDGFLFIEDDCVLSPDALDWTHFHLDHNIGLDKTWFASCESVFFDSKIKTATPEQIEKLRVHARKPEVRAAYVKQAFVPSTCFITTREVWEKCAPYRSFTRGPESLILFVKKHGAETLMPVVPRAADIGMLHDMGYSVATLGKDKVREIKNTYLMSELETLDTAEIGPYALHFNRLYSASVKLVDTDIAVLPRNE